jgi:hypothetical protein
MPMKRTEKSGEKSGKTDMYTDEKTDKHIEGTDGYTSGYAEGTDGARKLTSAGVPLSVFSTLGLASVCLCFFF